MKFTWFDVFFPTLRESIITPYIWEWIFGLYSLNVEASVGKIDIYFPHSSFLVFMNSLARDPLSLARLSIQLSATLRNLLFIPSLSKTKSTKEKSIKKKLFSWSCFRTSSILAQILKYAAVATGDYFLTTSVSLYRNSLNWVICVLYETWHLYKWMPSIYALVNQHHWFCSTSRKGNLPQSQIAALLVVSDVQGLFFTFLYCSDNMATPTFNSCTLPKAGTVVGIK